MKKWIFKFLSVITGTVIVLALYINSSFFIKNQEWKYSEGTHIGDWLEKNTFKINDRIIQTNSGKAKIIFSFGIKLIIENIETKERGFYINKG